VRIKLEGYRRMPAPHALYSKMLAERTASRNVLVLFILFIYRVILVESRANTQGWANFFRSSVQQGSPDPLSSCGGRNLELCTMVLTARHYFPNTGSRCSYASPPSKIRSAQTYDDNEDTRNVNLFTLRQL
jgi:hypothetical protein